jgi:hypothetical protein
LLKWGRAGRRNGREKVRVARSRDVVRRDLRKWAVGKLGAIVKVRKREGRKRHRAKDASFSTAWVVGGS